MFQYYYGKTVLSCRTNVFHKRAEDYKGFSHLYCPMHRKGRQMFRVEVMVVVE